MQTNHPRRLSADHGGRHASASFIQSARPAASDRVEPWQVWLADLKRRSGRALTTIEQAAVMEVAQ